MSTADRPLWERRIALRLARERATLTGDWTTEDENDAEAFIEAQRTSRTEISAPIAPPAASSDAGDDLDTIDDDDTDDDIDDATYYSDAFEDE
jgi:hypothetical protein